MKKLCSALKKATILLILFSAIPIFAEKTDIENTYHYTLKNGLELFVMENDSVPLTYIEIAVRAGAFTQNVSNAGLFHLYEHMMFKGNEKYKTASSVQKALKDFGVTSWNGTTASEHVNYYFTVPSDVSYEGLEFWSYAIRKPLLDKKEFENEKKVVISEIEGGYADPSTIYMSAINKELFPKFPWRLDPAGPVKNIENASIEQLKKIQQTYYIPNNAALFVGGNVEHEEIYKMVDEIYGDWEKGEDPWSKDRELQLQEPFATSLYLVMPHPQISDKIAKVSVTYRGPDTTRDIKSTYAADVFTTLSQNPQGTIIKTLMDEKTLHIPTPDYIGSGYSTQRESSEIIFNAILLSPKENIPQRAQLFEKTIQEKIAKELRKNLDYFSPKEYRTVKQRLQDSSLIESETAPGFLSTMRFWWNTTSSDYYFSYFKHMKEVTAKDIAAFSEKYMCDKAALVTVLINPAIYEEQKENFIKAGFKTITSENAFWWKENKGDLDE